MQCSNHPLKSALFRCPYCQKDLCQACVNTAGKSGSEFAYCNRCNNKVEEIPPHLRQPFWASPDRILKYPLKKPFWLFMLVMAVAVPALTVVVPLKALWYSLTVAVLEVAALFAMVVVIVNRLANPHDETDGLREAATYYGMSLVRFLVGGWPIWLVLGMMLTLIILFVPQDLLIETSADKFGVAFWLLVAYLIIFLLAGVLVTTTSPLPMKEVFNPARVYKVIKANISEHILMTGYLVTPFVVLLMAHALLHMGGGDSAASHSPLAAVAMETVMLVYLVAVFASMVGLRAYEIKPLFTPRRRHRSDTGRRLREMTGEYMRRQEDVRLRQASADAGSGEDEVALLETKLKHEPEDVPSLKRIFTLYQRQNNLEGLKTVGATLVHYYFKNRMLEDAAKTFEEVYALDKNFVLPPFQMRQLGDLYEAQRRWNAACIVWRNFAVHHSDSPLTAQALFRCASILAGELNKPEAAVQALRKLIYDFPNDPLVQNAEELLGKLVVEQQSLY